MCSAGYRASVDPWSRWRRGRCPSWAFPPRLEGRREAAFSFSGTPSPAEARPKGGRRPVCGCLQRRARFGARVHGGRIGTVRGVGFASIRPLHPKFGSACVPALVRETFAVVAARWTRAAVSAPTTCGSGRYRSGKPGSGPLTAADRWPSHIPPRRGGRHHVHGGAPAGGVTPRGDLLTVCTPTRRGLRSAEASPARRRRPGPGNTRRASPPPQAGSFRADAGRRPHTGRSRRAPPPR